MSKLSQLLAQAGPAGQELNAIGAALEPILVPAVAGIAASAVTGIVNEHIPTAQQSAVDNIVDAVLNLFGLQVPAAAPATPQAAAAPVQTTSAAPAVAAFPASPSLAAQ